VVPSLVPAAVREQLLQRFLEHSGSDPALFLDELARLRFRAEAGINLVQNSYVGKKKPCV
jgi:hypothetical protein